MENQSKFMKRTRYLAFAVISVLFSSAIFADESIEGEVVIDETPLDRKLNGGVVSYSCLLYTSPSPRDRQKSRMPSSA